MKTADELWELLNRARHMPYGVAKTAAIEQVIAHTEAVGDRHLAFAARMDATEAYQFGGEDAKSFVTFSWCVSDFDKDPQPFHERYLHSLLWAFKWIAGGLRDFPEVPLARTYAVLDDMERRYREAGNSLQAVYKIRFWTAQHLGDDEAAAKWYGLWQSTPRDALSDCEGCDPSAQIEYFVSLERDAEAIEAAGPVLAGHLNCERQPQRILTSVMVPYLRTGRLDDAADAHRRAYRIVRGKIAELDAVGDHLEFCARTGNERRGLEILARHIDWLDQAPSPGDLMRYAARAALLLRRLIDLGRGELTVPRHGAEVTVTALHAELSELARSTAARFDARNRTGAQSALVERILTAEPFEVALELSPSARRTATAPVPPPAPEPPVTVPEGLDADALLDLAESYEHAEREPAMDLVLTEFDRRFGPAATELTPEQAARRAGARVGQVWRTGDMAAAEAAAGEAAELYRAAGMHSRASSLVAAQAVMRAHGSRLGPDDLAVCEGDLAYQLANGAERAQVLAHIRLAGVQFALDRDEDALATLGRITTTDENLLARVGMQKARVLLKLERLDDATAAITPARDHYRAHGPADRAAYAHVTYGRVAMDAEAAVAAFDEALSLGVFGVALEAHLGRARELMRLGRPADAVADYVEVVALHAEHGPHEPGSGGFLREELARAYEQAGRWAEAAEVAEEALAELDKLPDPAAGDDTRMLLAGAYRQLGDPEQALNLYLPVAARLAEAGHSQGRASVLLEVADTLYRMDRDDEAADVYAETADEFRKADLPLGEMTALRRRVSALRWAGDDDPAVGLAAVDLAIRRHDEMAVDHPRMRYERALLGHAAADLLVAHDREAEALPHVDGSPAALRELGADSDAARSAMLLVYLLEQLGEPERAAAVRVEFDLNDD